MTTDKMLLLINNRALAHPSHLVSQTNQLMVWMQTVHEQIPPKHTHQTFLLLLQLLGWITRSNSFGASCSHKLTDSCSLSKTVPWVFEWEALLLFLQKQSVRKLFLPTHIHNGSHLLQELYFPKLGFDWYSPSSTVNSSVLPLPTRRAWQTAAAASYRQSEGCVPAFVLHTRPWRTPRKGLVAVILLFAAQFEFERFVPTFLTWAEKKKTEEIMTERLVRHRSPWWLHLQEICGENKWPSDSLIEYWHHMCAGIRPRKAEESFSLGFAEVLERIVNPNKKRDLRILVFTVSRIQNLSLFRETPVHMQLQTPKGPRTRRSLTSSPSFWTWKG